MQLLLIPVVIAATVLTYTVTCHVLNNFSAVGPPRVIAAAVALLSGLGLLHVGEAVVTLILLPYAALGLTLLLLMLLKWLLRSGAWHQIQRFFEDETPPRPKNSSSRLMRPEARKVNPPARLRETPPTKE